MILLRKIYEIKYFLDKLYPGENFNKEMLLCYLAGALIDEHSTIIVLSDYIEIARMFVENVLSAIPSLHVLKFSGNNIREYN